MLKKIVTPKSLIASLELLLVLLLAWVCANSLWLFFTPAERPLSTTSAQTTTQFSTPPLEQSASNLTVLSVFDPFSRTSATIPAEQPVALAPETSLDLKLLGVRQTLSDTQSSSAIIRLPNSKEQVFAIDDEIIRGVTLKEIYSTHITITRTGVAETLYLEGVDPEQVQQANSTFGTAKAPGPALQSEDRASFINRSASFQALSNLTNGLQITPNEVPKGLRIDKANDPNLLQPFGLQQDDIIVSMNGQPTANENRLFAMIANIDLGRPLQFKILRDGRLLDFRFTLER